MGIIEDQETYRNTVVRQQKINQSNDDYMLRKARANLFMNQDSMIDYLASERFPDDPNASFRYKVNDQGDLLYWDDSTADWQKEFPDLAGYGVFGDKVVPNLVPATTFVADVAGGIIGAQKGFQKGLELAARGPKNPWIAGATILGSTAAGGVGGNLIIGGGARTARGALIDQFYNLPPEEVATAIRDLGISSSFSAIPFGMGPTRKIVNKFLGREDSLRYLVELREDTSTIIQEAGKMGIDLTAAEAGEIANKGINIQYFLSAQPQVTKIREFYGNRALQVREAVELFADNIGSGKTVGDINTRIQEAAKFTIDELVKRRKTRARKLYDYIKNVPDGIKVENVQAVVKKIDNILDGKVFDKETGELLNTISPSDATIKNFTKLKKMFFDADGNLIDDLSSLDQRRTSGMQELLTKLKKKGTDDFGNMLGVMEDLTAIMDEAEPLYRLARRVWDPNKPAMLQIEKSAIGRLSKLMNDKQTATAMKNLFDPNVSTKSLRNAKRLLRTVDPDAWADVKKEFILQNLDKFSNASLEGGMPAFQKFMSKSNVMNMMEEVLEPEEFANWSRMMDFMGSAFNNVPRGYSPTQPFGALEEIINQESKNMSAKALNLGLSMVRFIPRLLTGQVGDDLTRGIAIQQKEAYMQKMADVLIDPDASKTIDEIYDVFNKSEYGIKQTGTRAISEGVEEITEDKTRPYMGTPVTEGLRGQIQDFEMPDIATPAFEPDLDPMQMASATILPDEKDREIAMRQQLGGIGSLG